MLVVLRSSTFVQKMHRSDVPLLFFKVFSTFVPKYHLALKWWIIATKSQIRSQIRFRLVWIKSSINVLLCSGHNGSMSFRRAFFQRKLSFWTYTARKETVKSAFRFCFLFKSPDFARTLLSDSHVVVAPDRIWNRSALNISQAWWSGGPHWSLWYQLQIMFEYDGKNQKVGVHPQILWNVGAHKESPPRRNKIII